MANTGFACTDENGGVFLATVAQTERAAMVNALVSLYQTPVFQQDSDNHITQNYSKFAERYGHKIKPVTVHVSNLI